MARSRTYSSVMRIIFACLIATELPVSVTTADDLLGAKAALQQVQELPAKVDPEDETTGVGITILELPARLATLAPADAATAWFEVYDEWQNAIDKRRPNQQVLPFRNLVDALPSPEAWPELVRLINARPVEGSEQSQMRTIGLRMLGHRLCDRTDLLKQDVEQALKLVEAPEKGGDNAKLDEIVGKDLQDSNQDSWKQDALSCLTEVKNELEPHSVVEQFRSNLASHDLDYEGSVQIPDLVRLMGREQATPLLEKVLQLKNAVLNFDTGRDPTREENETIELARELARKHLKEFSRPHWELCKSVDAIDLFEAFSAMLEPDDEEVRISPEYDLASMWYVMGLAVRDRVQDALKILGESHRNATEGRIWYFIANLNMIILPELERAGHARKVHVLLTELLKTRPELPLWDIFLKFSARHGKSEQALILVEGAIANGELPRQTRTNLEQIRTDALLAADRIDEGIAQEFRILAENNDNHRDLRRSRMDSALLIAEMGLLLEREEWVCQGTDIAEKLTEDFPGWRASELVNLLINLKQLARAERVIVKTLDHETTGKGKQLREEHRLPRGFGDDSTLESLLSVYHAAGRAADAVMLLEEAPWWSEGDIGEMLEKINLTVDGFRSSNAGRRHNLLCPQIAAESLAAVGRKDEALRIVREIISHSPGFDPAWQLALELMGEDFVPFAEQVFARNRFEERPLIWLAKFHLDRGNLVEAEMLARRAIAIDPSDGEQGRGDRMRAYSILAETLKIRDAKAASIYERAVNAIRLSEQADYFYSVGLLTRAINMYRESLALFADAYCIQSRLAVRLAEAGDLEGAAQHYQRAFELMPDSFGRVESHCFGCERVFEGQVAEKIAERVFLKLVEDQPTNPRIHYLLGYLRESELRNTEAVKSFREATRLDPDYFNAWKKLLSFAALDDALLTPVERDNATFQILRLDPLGSQNRVDTSKVQDLARLWIVLHDNARLWPDLEQQPIFELKAAKAALAVNEVEVSVVARQFRSQIYAQSQIGIGSHGTVSVISYLIEIVGK